MGQNLDFGALFSQILKFFGNLSKKQKIIIISGVVACVALVVFLAIFTKSKENGELAVLFEGLDARDTAAAVEHLKSQKIPYELSENAILVPKDTVYEQRITLSSLGIPKNSKVGFEIFDTQNFGTTSAEHQVKFLRAIEGELARSIESLSPIRSANVILALPKNSVFISEQIPPSASIVLNIHEGLALSHKQIFGIKNLVAAAIPKLDPEHVKIVNQHGEPLGENNELTASQDLATTQLQYRRNIEQILEGKIINILAPVVGGQDKVVARVSADFDFSQKKSLQEIYDPNNVVRSEQNLEEKRQGVNEQIGGVPGAVSNIGPVTGLNDESKEKYEKNQSTINYEVGKTVNEVKGEFGTLRRLSAAVVVDGKYRKNGEDFEYIALDPKALQNIDALVKQAIGFSDARGDNVSVSNFEFGAPKKTNELESATNVIRSYLSPLSPFLKYFMAILLLFVFYRAVILPFMKKMTQTEPLDPDEPRPLFEADLHANTGNEQLHSMRKRVEDSLEISNFDESQIKYDVLLERTRALVDERPEEVASMLQILIRDEIESAK